MESYFVQQASYTLKVVQAVQFRSQQIFNNANYNFLLLHKHTLTFVLHSTFAEWKRVPFLPRKKIMQKMCLFQVCFFLFCNLELQTESAARSSRNRNRKKLPDTHIHTSARIHYHSLMLALIPVSPIYFVNRQGGKGLSTCTCRSLFERKWLMLSKQLYF